MTVGWYRGGARARVLPGPGALLLGALLVVVPWGGGTLAAQEREPDRGRGSEATEDVVRGAFRSGDPVSPDSAEVLRAALERPPGDYPFDGYDALALPLRIVAFVPGG